MNITTPHFSAYTKSQSLKIGLLLLILSFTTQAVSGPSVNQLSSSLHSTWNTLLKVTNCNRPSLQVSQCIQPHHHKTISIKLFGETVNALILYETLSTIDISGPVITQQSGFLIGPINGYGYKVINEQMSHEIKHKRHIIDNGLKVFAHQVSGETISSQGVELNKGENWLDGKNQPWIYHWSALSRTNEILKEVKRHLNNNYK